MRMRGFGAQWQHKLILGDVFYNEDVPFTARRDEIVRRIKAQPWYDESFGNGLAESRNEELWWIVDELSDVDNEDYFDLVWGAFYDWCDVDKFCWVDTFRSTKGVTT